MTRRPSVLRKLEQELERLKRTLDLGHDLEVRWIPGCARYVNGRKIAGEVIGNNIFIYAENQTEALLVLRHEALEHALNIKFIAPYQKLVNVLLTAFEEQSYSEKEKLVKKLTRLIWGAGEKETE